MLSAAPFTLLFLTTSLAMASALPATGTTASASSSVEQGVVATPIAATSAPVVEAIDSSSPSSGGGLIPGMSDSGAIIMMVVIGCVLILVPMFGYIWIRRGRRISPVRDGGEEKGVCGGLERSESKISLVGTLGTRLERRDTNVSVGSVGSTDTWMDEVKMPTRVLTLKKDPAEAGVSVIRAVDV